MISIWPRSLFGRNVLLLTGTIILSVTLSFLTIYAFILNAQLNRFTSIGAELVNTISAASFELDADAMQALIAELDGNRYLQILPPGVEPEIGDYRENFFEKYIMQRVIDQLEYQNEMDWRMGHNRTLWLHLRIGNTYYWVASEAGTTWTPLRWLTFIFFVIVGVVTAIGVVATRHISRPLAALKQETDRLSLGSDWQLAKIEGPAEIQSLASSFQMMMTRLKEAESIRADTLAELSHDLRTPLARLRLAVEMIEGSDDLKDSATRQVHQLDRLIDQFMEYARDAEAESKTRFNLSEVMDEVAMQYAIEATLPPHIMLFGQKETIRRAVINLVENGQKYGKPPVRLSLHQTATHALIEVSDMGAGFDPQMAPDMLKSFRRGDHESAVSGAGLGLAIVARVAAMHAGEIVFSQRTPVGFEATLRLSLDASP